MFSLIITIISIALVAALALATLYFGGSAMQKGGDKATATRIVNEGSQVRGALELYRADNTALPTGNSGQIADTLIAQNYLRSMPNDGTWEFQNDMAVRTGLTIAQCEQINTNLGLTAAVPACTDLAAGKAACCSTV